MEQCVLLKFVQRPWNPSCSLLLLSTVFMPCVLKGDQALKQNQPIPAFPLGIFVLFVSLKPPQAKPGPEVLLNVPRVERSRSQLFLSEACLVGA